MAKGNLRKKIKLVFACLFAFITLFALSVTAMADRSIWWVNPSQEAGYYKTGIEITLNSTSGTTIEYRLYTEESSKGNFITYNDKTKIVISSSKYLECNALKKDKDPRKEKIVATYKGQYIIDLTLPTAGSNYESGIFKQAINVELTSSEEGYIYYTLDGAIPEGDNKGTTKGTTKLYSSAIRIDNDTTLKFIAMDKAGNRSVEVYTKAYIFRIPKITSINISRLSTLLDGKEITLKIDVSANNSENLLYQIWLQDARGWELVRPYDESPTFALNAARTRDDNYKVQVRIKDKTTGIMCDQKTEIATWLQLGIVRIDRVETSGTEVQGRGEVLDRIIITAYASRGTGYDNSNLEYSFEIWNANESIYLYSRGYDTSNSFLWFPLEQGQYNIVAKVRDKYTAQTHQMSMPFDIIALSDYYNYPELKKLIINDSNDKNILSQLNKKINIHAVSVGNKGNFDNWVYKFSIGEPWTGVNSFEYGYSFDKKCEWDPTGSGFYEAFALIKEKNSVEYEDGIRKYIRIPNPKGEIGLRLEAVGESRSSIPKDTLINFNATGQNKVLNPGMKRNRFQYSFWLSDSRGCRLVQDYSYYSTFKWKPARCGKYTVLARVKEEGVSGSYEVQKSMEFYVEDPKLIPITDAGLDVSGELKVRKNITLTAKALGSENLMYMVLVSDESFGGKVLNYFSTDKTFVWMPKKAGKYTLTLWVKDAISGSREVEFKRDIVISDNKGK